MGTFPPNCVSVHNKGKKEAFTESPIRKEGRTGPRYITEAKERKEGQVGAEPFRQKEEGYAGGPLRRRKDSGPPLAS